MIDCSSAFRAALGCLVAFAWPIVVADGLLASRAAADDSVGFNRQIRPLLADRCFACHGPDAGARQADLRLDQREGATAWAIVPGEPHESPLLERVAADDPDLQMPPADANKPRLSDEEVALVRQWIEQGAPYERHWSYVPPQRPTLPETSRSDWSSNPIDRLLFARWEAAGVSPSAPADKTTLVRRLYLDVTGVPPTPAEVDRFVANDSDEAYEQLADALLASPRYAERMASWWFDLVRFANTVGYHGDQEHHILPYRDYVLHAFHENLPFDQFTIEQLAGDLLAEPTLWQLVATGYNRLLQTSHEGGIQDGEYRAKMMADRVRNVSEVWMGASLGCAECHDHKFDPYSQREFYQLEAFFADVDHYGSFTSVAVNSSPTQRPPEMLAWTLPVARQIEAIDARLGVLAGKLRGRLPNNYRELQQEQAELKARRAELERQFVPTMITAAIEPREIRVLPRGNWMDDSGAVVQPGTPASLPVLESSAPRATRLDLARWLVSGEHPLTARATVNRLWRLYFGRGLSGNLIELGSQGEWPTHPELLDWLAVEFVESGWDVKHMVRLIVTSKAYRQSSHVSDARLQQDPDNRLFARQGRYRLEAEQIRDLALVASGLLVEQLGGSFARPYQPAGYYAALNFPVRKYQASEGDEQFRRAVYTHWQRQFLHPWLRAFDAPTREECTAERPISNTPSAALVLLNDPSFVEAARGLALSVGAGEARAADSADAAVQDRTRLSDAWRRVLSRQPNDEELATLQTLLDRQRELYASDPDAAAALLGVGVSPQGSPEHRVEIAAWTFACRAILNLSEAITRN